MCVGLGFVGLGVGGCVFVCGCGFCVLGVWGVLCVLCVCVCVCVFGARHFVRVCFFVVACPCCL